MDNRPEELAKLFKILGDANRLRIFFAIEHGESSVSEIIERTGLSQTLVSFHLKALRDADLVKTDRQGAFIFYRLTKATLLDLIRKFQDHLSETIKETGEMSGMELPFPCPPWLKTQKR